MKQIEEANCYEILNGIRLKGEKAIYNKQFLSRFRRYIAVLSLVSVSFWLRARHTKPVDLFTVYFCFSLLCICSVRVCGNKTK